ncbi:hypothetical protein VKT23_013747 [Stygiomarasmius scandens]|uniref:TFIIS N-terminal domain-containing protein n=1 Tax=Marasmiellus scandens TaxID=2682957 RepID=A0ABR1J1L7_9AGAR
MNYNNDPEATKVRQWRHVLQRTFLSFNKPMKELNMPTMDQLFKDIESYQDMTSEYIAFSKIGKVMRHITLLDPSKIPLEDQYKFRERAKKLMDQWNTILEADRVVEKVVEIRIT